MLSNVSKNTSLNGRFSSLKCCKSNGNGALESREALGGGVGCAPTRARPPLPWTCQKDHGIAAPIDWGPAQSSGTAQQPTHSHGTALSATAFHPSMASGVVTTNDATTPTYVPPTVLLPEYSAIGFQSKSTLTAEIQRPPATWVTIMPAYPRLAVHTPSPPQTGKACLGLQNRRSPPLSRVLTVSAVV